MLSFGWNVYLIARKLIIMVPRYRVGCIHAFITDL